MPPVIAAAAAAWAALTVAEVVLIAATVVISAGTAIYGAAQARKAERAAQASANAAMKDRMVTRIATEAPHRYVYGRAKVGADIVAMFTSGDKDQFKHLVCVHAAHECDAIEEVWVNNALVAGLDASGDPTTGRFAVTPDGEIVEEQLTGPTFTLTFTPRFGSVWVFAGTGADMVPVEVTSVNGRTVTVEASGPVTVSYEYVVRRKISDFVNEAATPSATNPVVRVQKHLGGANDVADAYLRSVVGDKWPATAVLRGMCYTVITLDLNQSEFQGGLVPIHAVLRGRKLYDPRDGQTRWSQNPALVIMDYLTSPLCGVPMADLPTAQFITAANVCDEASPTGGVRYTANGTVTSDQGQAAVLESMTQAMAGGLVATTWDVFAGKYVAPVAALVQEDIVGSLSVIPGVSDASIYNGVKGQYVGSENNHVQTDFKPYQNAVYRESDGRDLYTNIDFPFTDSLQRITNLARIFTEDQRNGFTIKAEFSLKAWPLKVGQRIVFTSKFLGQNAKVYRITDKSYAPNSAVQLSLKEDAPSIWDYADATEVDSTPNSDLPDPWHVSPPGAISCTSGQATLLRQADGSTIPRILVSLSLIQTMIGGQIEIEWRAVSSTAWSRMTISGTQTQAYLSPITPGFFYIVRARCVNPYLNTRSDWVATVYQVVVFSARPKVYKWSESLPAMPSGVSTYNWASSAFAAPAGWTPQITAAPTGGGLMLWAAEVLVTDISVDAPTQFYWASASINAISFEESAGLSNFTWTKYATSAAGANMSDSPAGMTHIGLAFNKASATESTDPADYTWAQFQGPAGTSAPLTSTAYLYRWSTVTPAKPNSTSSFGWAANANTGYAGTDGWTIDVPANPGTPLAKLFVAKVAVTAPAGTTSSTVSYSGSTVAAWSQNGSNGSNGAVGVQSREAVVFQWAATIPAGPAGSATLTWASGAFGAAPTGWTLTPGTAPSPGLTLFAARAGVSDSAAAVTTDFSWSTAAVMAIGYAGTNGGNGAEGASYVTSYCASSTMATSTLPGKTSGKSSVPAPNSGGIVGAYTKAVPALANGQFLYQSDGIYDPATNEVTWSIPYWSSLKVATLSAITANLGAINAGSINLGNGTFTVDNNGNMVCRSIVIIDPVSGNPILTAGGLQPGFEAPGTKNSELLPNISNAALSSFAAAHKWEFRNSLEGWSAVNAVSLGINAESFTLNATGFDPIIRSPIGLNFDGGVYPLVRARIKRLAGTGWDGNLYFATNTPGYQGEGQGGSGYVPDTTKLNEWVILEWNMSANAAWSTGIVSYFRPDMGLTAGDRFEIDWIMVGKIGTAVSVVEYGATKAAADAALARSDAAANDGILDRSEKADLILDWQTEDAVYAKIASQAVALGVDIQQYTDNHNATSAYLIDLGPNSEWSNTSKDTPIDRPLHRNRFRLLYEARQIAQNAILAKVSTAPNLNIGIGRNRLSNSAPGNASTYEAATSSGFGFSTPAIALATNNHDFAQYSRNGACVYVYVPGRPPAGTVTDLRCYRTDYRRIPVLPSTRYEVAVNLSMHRAQGQILVSWFSANGTLSRTDLGSVVPGNGPANGDVPRSLLFAVSPSDAAYAIVAARMIHTGDYDPYIFASQFHFGEALANQTVATPWAEGAPTSASEIDALGRSAANIMTGAGALISGNLTVDANGYRTGGFGTAMTQRGWVAFNSAGVLTFQLDGAGGNPYFAGQLSAAYGSFGDLRIASGGCIASGNYYASRGYAWPEPNEGGGIFINDSGILLGNARNGNLGYFQVESATGAIRAPGFSLENRQLTLTQPVLINPNFGAGSRTATITSSPADVFSYPRQQTNCDCGFHTAAISNPFSPTYSWSISGSNRPGVTFRLFGAGTAQVQVIAYTSGTQVEGSSAECDITCTITDGGVTKVISKNIYLEFY